MKTYSVSVDFKGSAICRIQIPTYVKARAHTSDIKTICFKEDDCIPVVKAAIGKILLEEGVGFVEEKDRIIVEDVEVVDSPDGFIISSPTYHAHIYKDITADLPNNYSIPK